MSENNLNSQEPLAYGSVTRSSSLAYTEGSSSSGQITPKLVLKAIETMWEQSSKQASCFMEFEKKLKEYEPLLDRGDLEGYLAGYWLTASCFYAECALHPAVAMEYISILKDRGMM